MSLCVHSERPYPCNKHVLRKAGVGILHFGESKLDPAIRELVNEVYELPLCVKQSVQASCHALPYTIPPVLCTFKTLSLPESCWKALTNGA